MPAFSNDAATLPTLVQPSSERCPNAASRSRQSTSRNMPIAIAQTSTLPNGCCASSLIAPEVLASWLWSPSASCTVSHASSRCTTP